MGSVDAFGSTEQFVVIFKILNELNRVYRYLRRMLYCLHQEQQYFSNVLLTNDIDIDALPVEAS
jgi:hypothetical protein